MELKAGESTGDLIKEMDDITKRKMRKSYHLLAIAYNNEGYKNLVHLSSWAWKHGFYYKPRINYEILAAHKEGIIFSSACYQSEIGQALETQGEDAAMEMVQRYKEMLPIFYLEMMFISFKKQKAYDAFLIKAAEKFNLPLIVTNDVHFAVPEDSQMQRYMMAIQTGRPWNDILADKDKADKGLLDDKGNPYEYPFELQDDQIWMKSEGEINAKWESDYSDVVPLDVFNEAKRNTVRICEQSKGVTLDKSIKLPQISDANNKFKQDIMEGFQKRNLPKTKVYLDRIKEEYNLITEKEFASYFLINKMMTDEARRWWAEKTGGSGAEAVGPGRGSAAGALVAYCLGITDVDPIKHDLLFSRFLSPARGGKTIKLRFKNVKPIETKGTE
jgi:DNA polymerase-3 subunit alpha